MTAAGDTKAFVAAVQRSDADTVETMLADAGPEAARLVGEALADGRTALHLAVTAEPAEMQYRTVRLLCAQRADPNARAGGVTAYHLGVQHCSKFIVRALLCARADNLALAEDGRSSVDFAKESAAATELFQLVGWPGQGPFPEPLNKRSKGPAQPAPMQAGGAASASLPVPKAFARVASAAATANLRIGDPASSGLVQNSVTDSLPFWPTGPAAAEILPDAGTAKSLGAVAGEGGAAPDGPKDKGCGVTAGMLAGPLLLAALWFLLLAVAAAWVIRSV